MGLKGRDSLYKVFVFWRFDLYTFVWLCFLRVGFLWATIPAVCFQVFLCHTFISASSRVGMIRTTAINYEPGVFELVS